MCEIPETRKGLLQFNPYVEGDTVFAAVDDLAEEEGVVELKLQCRSGGDRTLEFEADTTCGHILDATGDLDIGLPEKSDPDGLIDLEARFAPLIHDQHIGWREGNV